MIERMAERLAGHSMYTGEAARTRLQMCPDCRIVDMMENQSQISVFDLKP
jgi:hypothetical protein